VTTVLELLAAGRAASSSSHTARRGSGREPIPRYWHSGPPCARAL